MTSEPASSVTSTSGPARNQLPKPSSNTGSDSPTPEQRVHLSRLGLVRAIAATRQLEDEPIGVGEILQNLMFQSRTRSPMAGLTPPQQTRALWRMANVPARHSATVQDESGAPERWTKMRNHILGRSGSGFLFALLGPRGTGKTQIGVQALIHQIAIGRQALYVKAMDVFLWVRQARLKDAALGDLDLIAEFLSPRLLVIDELGERGESEWEDRLLVYIIDKRYDAVFDTLLLANLTEQEFRQSMGPSIADRLRECGGAIACDWPSFRQIKP